MSRYLLPLFAVLLLSAPNLANAQYMYLDSNGDGVHTSADVLHGVGTTQVDVWLRTDHNRDGSVATCGVDPSLPMNIVSYEFLLQVVDGTVTWTNLTNFQPTMTVSFGTTVTPTLLYMGRGGTITPAGDYHLARVTAEVTTGSPAIQIVSGAPRYIPETAFGSQCLAHEMDNTMRLGLDWSDVDGLAFDAGGGSPNGPPTIPAIADFTVPVGETAASDLAITDADGDLIDVQLASGPSFVSATPIASASGSVTASIHVRPRRGNEGDFDASLAASDGAHASDRSFHITVVSGPNHAPQIDDHSPVDIVAGTIGTSLLTGSDSDGDAMTFTLLEGPPFAQVRTGRSGGGGGTGFLTLRPTLCDIGPALARIGVSDGAASTTLDVQVLVRAPQDPPATPARPFAAGGALVADVAAGDFNEDGHQDVALATGPSTGGMTIALGDGTGGFSVAAPIDLGSSSEAVTVGDWNADGHLDAAVGVFSQGNLSVLYGRGDGTFADAARFPAVIQTNRLLSFDANRDGVQDLVAVGEGSAISVLLGHTGAGLALSYELPGPGQAKSAAVGDFNQDGALDLALTQFNPGQITLLFGRGDGTFGDSYQFTVAARPFGIVSGDWNGDGRLDLVTANIDGQSLTRFLGDGAGGFATTAIGPIGYHFGADLEAVDWDGDGQSDLLFPESGPLMRGMPDGSFQASPLQPGLGADYKMCAGDFNEDGRPDLAGSRGSAGFVELLNTTLTPAGVSARAFVSATKTIPAVPSSSSLCARVEPVAGTFQPTDVDGASIQMVSTGTGSVSSIPATYTKQVIVGDTDHNSIVEFPACFLMTDVARLFDGLRGKQEVHVEIQGSLLNGTRFCAPMRMTIVGKGGGALAGQVTPNPMNPRGVLRFTVEREGPVTVQLFDSRGHLVRTLWQAHKATPGAQEVPIDGFDSAGRPMAGGVYFFRIETAEHASTGRFVVLK